LDRHRPAAITSSRSRFTRFHGFLLASVLLIGTTVLVAGLAVGRFLEEEELRNEEEQTAKLVRTLAQRRLAAADFALPDHVDAASPFAAILHELPDVFRLKVFDRTGRIVWSDEPRLIGQRYRDNPNLTKALSGQIATVFEVPEKSEHVYEQGKGYVAEAYVPITFPDRMEVAGVIETYKDITALVAGIHRAQRLVWGVAGGAGFLLYLALALVVWTASRNELRAIARLEEQLSRSERLATVGEMAAGLAHELRNPLTGISGALHVLSAELPPGTRAQGFLGDIQTQVARMNKTLTDLLWHAQPPVPLYLPLDVNEVLEQNLRCLPIASSSGIRINQQLQHGLPLLRLDPNLLHQAFLNVLINALQAMPDGGQLTVRTALAPSVTTGKVVEVTIADTGVGIRPEHLARIFQPFFTTKAQGTGLGLTIATRIVEQHAGGITVESAPGAGTAFRITLPVPAADAAPGANHAIETTRR
jgi:signal transduction histidine kinase